MKGVGGLSGRCPDIGRGSSDRCAATTEDGGSQRRHGVKSCLAPVLMERIAGVERGLRFHEITREDHSGVVDERHEA